MYTLEELQSVIREAQCKQAQRFCIWKKSFKKPYKHAMCYLIIQDFILLVVVVCLFKFYTKRTLPGRNISPGRQLPLKTEQDWYVQGQHFSQSSFIMKIMYLKFSSNMYFLWLTPEYVENVTVHTLAVLIIWQLHRYFCSVVDVYSKVKDTKKPTSTFALKLLPY